MERNLFNELTVAELQEVDGGEWKQYYNLIIQLTCPVPGLGFIVAKDLERVYNDTYDKTIAMNK